MKTFSLKYIISGPQAQVHSDFHVPPATLGLSVTSLVHALLVLFLDTQTFEITTKIQQRIIGSSTTCLDPGQVKFTLACDPLSCA